MGIDAVAVLRISNLAPPSTGFGTTFLVQHRGDCSLLHTMQRFEGTPLDEHVLTVRRILGDALDAHDDPRGVLVFPDVCEPRGSDYVTIVREVEGAGGFGPMVTASHVPLRLTNAPAGSYDELVREVRERAGEEGELALTLAEVSFMVAKADLSRRDEYTRALDGLRATMGEGFVRRLEPLLERRFDETTASQHRFLRRVERLTQERFEAPVVSADELDQFFDSGQATAMLESLGPGFQEHLQRTLASLGVPVEELPEDDLARRLAEAAGLSTRPPAEEPPKRGRKKR